MNKKNFLRIAHYNIFRGGFRRLGKISKVIKEINPDILGVLEAVKWQENKKYYKNFASKMGFKYYYLSLANSRHNIAVLSKYPLNFLPVKENMRNVAAKVSLKKGPFKHLEVFFIHMSPKEESSRILEFKTLLKNKSPKKSGLIMGDLNSLSPCDPYDKTKLLKRFQKLGITKYGINNLKFDLIKEIEKKGFVDTHIHFQKKFISTVPTPFNTDPHHATKLRIDYAFINKEYLPFFKKIEILKNKNSNMASDHYPIFIDLQK